MYLFINTDQSINFAADHPVDTRLSTKDVQVVELPEYTLDEVMGQLPLEETQWDEGARQVVYQPDFMVGSEEWRRQQAGRHIKKYYPLSKQLNILRGSDKDAKKVMVIFIEKCRAWSNDLTSEPAAIAAIMPSSLIDQ